jgi:hypothetical protein
MFRLTMAIVASFCLSTLAAPVVERTSSSSLQKSALQKVLQDASPIFGDYATNHSRIG